MEIDITQFGWVLLELGQRFEDDMILVGLRIECADLSLAKSVVKRGVDLVWSDVEARRGGPVNLQMRANPVGLLIGHHISNLWNLFQFGDELGGPLVQLG